MIGQTVSHYRIIEKLGGGGMGVVYKAEDTRLKRTVALKFLPEEMSRDRTALERFEREAQAASALNHPNICTIHDIGETEAGRFIAMELVDGRTLRALTGLALEGLCRIGRQAAEALAAAHAAGIVHRDIKPENIMVREDGYVKVLDFGLARVAPVGMTEKETASAHVTAAGTILGTVRYMSPEQARGESAAAPSDMFSLGIVLYELATGQHPFAAASQLETLHAIVFDAPVPPVRLRPEIPEALEDLILQMMEKDPRLRPTAAAAQAVLAEHKASAVSTPVAAPLRHTVGREKEVAQLYSAYDSALKGRGLMACVTGEAGIGKTALIDNFLADLTARGKPHRIARGRCSERLSGTDAYLPILEALESLLHGENGEAVSRTMKAVAPTWYVQVAPLAPEDSSFARALAEAKTASQERMKRELGSFLQEASRIQPLVLFLDNLHWADVSTVDVLAYIGSKLESMRLMVIVAYRTSELLLAKHPFVTTKLELQGRGLAREIAVEFLSPDDLGKYLALEFPEHRFPPELPDVIHRRTEGNALFLVDLVRYLKDRRIITLQEGQWVLAQSLPVIERELPESVRSMIEKNISRLSDADRRILAAASVQGQEFDSAVVAAAVGAQQADVEQRLEELDHVHGLVRLAGDRELPDSTFTLRYSFVHLLYQNALFNSLTATRKAALSAALAGALVGFYGDRASEAASELALLFETARDFARASDYFLMAAGNARRIYANQEALSSAQRAMSNAERLKGTARHAAVAAAAILLAEIHLTLTLPEKTVADLLLAEEAARECGQKQPQFVAIAMRSSALVMMKQQEEGERLAVRALEMAYEAGDDVDIALTEALLAGNLTVRGELEEADRYYARAIPILQRKGPLRQTFNSCGVRALMHEWRLEHTELEEILAWMRPRAAEIGGSYYFLLFRYTGALGHGNQGRLSYALSDMQELHRLAELSGDRFYIPRIPNVLGWLYRELLDTEAALKWDSDGARIAREMGCDEAEANSHVNLGHDYLALGEPACAYEHLEEAVKIFQRDEWYRWRYNIRLQAERASYWIGRGDLNQATAYAAASLESAKITLSRKHWAWAHKLLGDIALLEDRAPDARREYEQALAILERHRCPIIEWKILLAAAEAARLVRGASAANSLRARASHVIQSLAESISDPAQRERFLAAKPIRDI